jgi:hypothetical protein
MDWKAPAFDEIKMDAEIGSYQEDYDPGREPVADERPEAQNAQRGE